MKHARLLIYEIRKEQYIFKESIARGHKDFQKNSEYLILTSSPYIKNGFLSFSYHVKSFFENMYLFIIVNKFKKIDKIGVIIHCDNNFNINSLDSNNYNVLKSNVFWDFQDATHEKKVEIFYMIFPLVMVLFFVFLSYCAYIFKEPEQSNASVYVSLLMVILFCCLFVQIIPQFIFPKFISRSKYECLMKKDFI